MVAWQGNNPETCAEAHQRFLNLLAAAMTSYGLNHLSEIVDSARPIATMAKRDAIQHHVSLP